MGGGGGGMVGVSRLWCDHVEYGGGGELVVGVGDMSPGRNTCLKKGLYH